jgi:hypothetical protein
VAPSAPRASLRLVGEAPDLHSELLADHASGNYDICKLLRSCEHTSPVDDQDRSQLEPGALGTPSALHQLDSDLLPREDAFLLASRLDHCVHEQKSLHGLEEGLVEDDPSSPAHGADPGQRFDETFGNPLPGHLDEAQLRDVEHLRAGLVPCQCGP